MEAEDRRSRFKSMPWAKHASRTRVAVFGAGGIGSWLALYLNRMGVQVDIWDDDVVELQNLGGQLYHNGAVGQLKVDSVEDIIKFLGDSMSSMTLIGERWNMEDYDECNYKFVFSCLDNIKTRGELFEWWLSGESENGRGGLFIDGRMLAEDGEVYAVDRRKGGHTKAYRSTLFTRDENDEEVLCTARATSHCGSLIAIIMTSLFTNYLVNQEFENLRDVPFKTEFHLPMMDFSLNFLETNNDFASVRKETTVPGI